VPFLPGTATAIAPIHVAGNRFEDTSGREIRLLGVTRASPEYTCVEPVYSPEREEGVFEGPHDQPSVAAMAAWGMTVVRVPLNEDCWLGLNPVRRSRGKVTPFRTHLSRAKRRLKARYRGQIDAFVNTLHAKGLYAILDLHWSAPGRTLAGAQWPLPDRDHAVAFWKSVAHRFKADPFLLFELFNEPVDQSGSVTRNGDSQWACLRDGCRQPNGPVGGNAQGHYRSAGIQSLVDAVRSQGATQPVIVPGLNYSNDLSLLHRYAPHDPLRQLAVAYHTYRSAPDPLYCASETCWDSQVAPYAAVLPVVATEFGNLADDCDPSFDNAWMAWADAHQVAGYLGWAWWSTDPPDQGGPACGDLINNDYTGQTPTPRGAALRSHFHLLAGQ
jgi:endoglucanase